MANNKSGHQTTLKGGIEDPIKWAPYRDAAQDWGCTQAGRPQEGGRGPTWHSVLLGCFCLTFSPLNLLIIFDDKFCCLAIFYHL